MKNDFVSAILENINKGNAIIVRRSNNMESSETTIIPEDIQMEDNSFVLYYDGGVQRVNITEFIYDEFNDEYVFSNGTEEISFAVA